MGKKFIKTTPLNENINFVVRTFCNKNHFYAVNIMPIKGFENLKHS